MAYERRIVHAAVIKGLKSSDVAFHHEYTLPNGSRADFVFFEDHTWKIIVGVLEVKCDCQNIQKSISQVLGYKRQFGGAVEPWVIVPIHTRTNMAMAECAAAGVNLGFVRCECIEIYRAKVNCKRSLGIL